MAGRTPAGRLRRGDARRVLPALRGAMTLMLRTLGVPARVAVGFTAGTWKAGVWTVTDHQAHAWVEAWFAGYGWLAFDPTPGRGTLSAVYTLASDSADAVRGARDGPVPRLHTDRALGWERRDTRRRGSCPRADRPVVARGSALCSGRGRGARRGREVGAAGTPARPGRPAPTGGRRTGRARVRPGRQRRGRRTGRDAHRAPAHDRAGARDTGTDARRVSRRRADTARPPEPGRRPHAHVTSSAASSPLLPSVNGPAPGSAPRSRCARCGPG